MKVRVTWWGHATVMVEVAGLRVLTDPVVTGHIAYLLRRVDRTAPSDAASGADVVVVSHLHADHLHLQSLRRIAYPATLVVPAGAAPLATRAWSGPIRELCIGDTIAFGAVTVTAVAAYHDGRRFPGAKTRAPALGYVIAHAGLRIWFAGDTGWFSDLAALAPITVALVPVGGWGPTLGPHHLNPEEAARAVALTHATHAVPIHYGTFWPTGLRRLAPALFTDRFLLPGSRFEEAVQRMTLPTEVHILRFGEPIVLEVGSG